MKRYISANGPVNSRTTQPKTARDAPVPPVVSARIQTTRARHLLGMPLADSLIANRHQDHRNINRPRAAMVLQATGSAVFSTGLLLGLIQSSTQILTFSALALVAFGAWAYKDARQRRSLEKTKPWKISQLVEAEDIEQLDSAIEKIAAQSSQDTLDRLIKLKESITRCVHLIGSTQNSQVFSAADHLYVRECIRRYAPDSIHSCLKIPAKDRSTIVIDGRKPALDLLHDQFDLILLELEIHEERLTQISGESLIRQQNFLSEKAKTRI